MPPPDIDRQGSLRGWKDGAERTLTKEWEFGLLFVRLFRSLDSIVGEESTARNWLTSDNRGLNGRPLDLISNTEGLVRVVHYLDASRGLV